MVQSFGLRILSFGFWVEGPRIEESQRSPHLGSEFVV